MTRACNSSETPIIGKRILFGVIQDSYTKILRSLLLLHCLQPDDTIPAICGSSYTARSSPHFKHYNAPISMQTVTDNDRYLCIAIPTIKQRDLGGYEKITPCKSYSYEDLKLSAPSITIPTIKRHDLGDYEEITTCKLCSYENSKYPHHQLQSQQSSGVI